MQIKITDGLTFDDILLIPQYSELLPVNVDLATRLTKNITLKIPIVSSAMDTVTESRLAIKIAQEGGIGIIHKNMPPKIQAEEVARVKKSESLVITNPITLSPDESVDAAYELMRKHDISGLPVTKDKKLVGILTRRDLRFLDNPHQKIKNVMTSKNLVTVKNKISIKDAMVLLQKHKIEKLLVVDEGYNLVGLITTKDIEKSTAYPNASKDQNGRLLVGAACGVGKDKEERIERLIGAGVDLLVIDSAHGHSRNVLSTCGYIRAKYSGCEVVAGNVATGDGAKALIDAGADCIKVGVGPGSICTTRVVAGIGVPQVTAIVDAVGVAEKANMPVMADGGIRYSGDIVKALAFGAETVMIGNLFAGTDESPGETLLYQGRSYKIYRGMGSLSAMKKGSKDRYAQDEITESKFVPEGVEGRVPARGPLSNCIYQLLGGVRAGLAYVGAPNISSLKRRAKFVKISTAALRESHVHDVIVTEEPPNYRLS